MFKELEAFKEIIDKFADQIMRANKEELTATNKTNAIEYLYRTPQVRLLKQALQRLDEYEQILGNGRLTDRNYKNTTLPLDSCKPYLRLGQLEDIYEESKRCK